MQIPISEVLPKMIFNDGKDDVLVNEVWNQGRGLGVVIKGMIMDNGDKYFRRFMNSELMIDVKARNM